MSGGASRSAPGARILRLGRRSDQIPGNAGHSAVGLFLDGIFITAPVGGQAAVLGYLASIAIAAGANRHATRNACTL